MRLDFWRRATVPVPAAQRKEPSLRISEAVLAYASSKGPEHINPFKIWEPPPGVVPKSATMAMDADLTAIANWAAANSFGDGMYWLGYTLLAELSQRPEYRRISSVKAKEMTRKWIRLQALGDEGKSEEIRRLGAAMKRFKLQDSFRRCAELDGLFGRGHLHIDLGTRDDEAELKTLLPIHPDKITKGSLKRFRVVEPMWTYPGAYNSTEPLRPDFYKPQTWWVMGREIHSSRLLTFIGNEMPDMLKPAYMFGGISLTQMAKPYVDLWLRDRTSVSEIVEFFSTSVLATNMAARMNENGGSGLIDRVKAFVAFRKNRGTLVIDKETEEFKNVSAPLATLDKLQAQSQEHICSAIGMPLIKYTGVTPSGLNASSDAEIRSWYDDIAADQEDMFGDNLVTALRVLQLNEFGRIDDGITHDFISLWQLDEAGQAAVQLTKAQVAAAYIDAGVISQEEERERLASDPESMYGALDLSAPLPEPPDDDESGASPDNPLVTRIDDAGAAGSMAGANSGV